MCIKTTPWRGMKVKLHAFGTWWRWVTSLTLRSQHLQVMATVLTARTPCPVRTEQAAGRRPRALRSYFHKLIVLATCLGPSTCIMKEVEPAYFIDIPQYAMYEMRILCETNVELVSQCRCFHRFWRDKSYNSRGAIKMKVSCCCQLQKSRCLAVAPCRELFCD